MFTSFKKSVLLLGLLAGGSINQKALAQTNKTNWTLQECVDYGLKSNLQIKQAQLDAQGTKITANQARADMLPSLNASTNYGFNFGRNIDPTTDAFINQQIQSSGVSLSANVPLFNGFQVQNNIKRSRLNYEAFLSDVERTRNDVILNIISAYLQVIYSDELLKTAQLQLNNTQQQAERTQKLFRAGSVAETNVLELNAQMATDEVAIINAQNQKDLAELSLLQLLDLKEVKDFEVVKPEIKDPDQDIITYNAESVYDVAQQRMPEIRSADLRVSSALVGVNIARGAYFPRLSIGGSISSTYSSFNKQIDLVETPVTVTVGYVNGDRNLPVLFETSTQTVTRSNYGYFNQLNDNRGQGVFFSLSIPILNGFQVRNNVAQSIITHKSAILNTEIVRNQLRQTIQQAYADALASQKKFASTKKQLAALEQSYKNAEIRFNNGLLNPTDYNVARNNFVRAQSDLIQAKFDYTFRLKVLDFYQGKPLSL